jgi:hypothetical protein
MEQRPNRANNVPKQRRLRYACWAALTLLLGVLLLPYLLVPLYRVVNPVSTLMLWRWAHGMRVEKTFTPITRIGPALPITVIAAEDGRYCRHRGVDWEEIRERIEDVDNIREARGVSTITQQTAKNLFLWPGRSFVRKALARISHTIFARSSKVERGFVSFCGDVLARGVGRRERELGLFRSCGCSEQFDLSVGLG